MAVEVAQYALQELMKEEAPPEEGTPLVYSPRKADPEAITNAIETTLSNPMSRRAFFKRKVSETQKAKEKEE